jgi:ABC-type transport system involved in multi-copper enzyme maturation permease subunit
MNAIVRGDFRARLTSPNGRTVFTIFLGVLGVIVVLSLPPELGRLDEVRGESLLLTVLLLETIFIGYLTAAIATGEIAIDAEKSVEDLASAPFSSQDIGRGKVLSALGFAGLLIAFAAPVLSIVAGVQGEPLVVIVRAGAMTLLFGGVVGAIGEVWSAIVESDFSRSLLHWTTLLLIVAGGAALPGPWNIISPLYAVPAVVHRTGGFPLFSVVGGYVVIMVASMWAIQARVEVIRRHAHF